MKPAEIALIVLSVVGIFYVAFIMLPILFFSWILFVPFVFAIIMTIYSNTKCFAFSFKNAKGR